ncbi:NADP-dependent oxidoreductase domain-containing protein [Bombardia bombarda]|uniref:NADP-dependent oxidoreductase domain-containing protein n=1 Tax=Bombardia bombarda TaxID=252184 RepID=A0AA39X034_9PEZI|nr:NADP-dependent oxidoreductase domain-containing protein [Bombardia bombarda]
MHTPGSSTAYAGKEDRSPSVVQLHSKRRADIFLATKFGIKFSVNDKGDLQKMGVDYVDLCYVHRLDPKVPVEKTIELLAKAKKDGKIKAIGITVFAYSPLGRCFLTGQIRSTDDFAPDDFRRIKGCTPGQLVLAWLSVQGEDIILIPGTKKLKYLEENVEAVKVHLSKEEVQEIRDEVEKAEVAGHRNPPGLFTEYSVTVEL